MELAKEVYRVTSQGEFSRDHPLRTQLRKASISVISNIAEGFERDGDREFSKLKGNKFANLESLTRDKGLNTTPSLP